MYLWNRRPISNIHFVSLHVIWYTVNHTSNGYFPGLSCPLAFSLASCQFIIFVLTTLTMPCKFKNYLLLPLTTDIQWTASPTLELFVRFTFIIFYFLSYRIAVRLSCLSISCWSRITKWSNGKRQKQTASVNTEFASLAEHQRRLRSRNQLRNYFTTCADPWCIVFTFIWHWSAISSAQHV